MNKDNQTAGWVEFQSDNMSYGFGGYIDDQELVDVLSRIIPWVDFIAQTEGSETGEYFGSILTAIAYLVPVLSYGSCQNAFKKFCKSIEKDLQEDMTGWLAEHIVEEGLEELVKDLPKL